MIGFGEQMTGKEWRLNLVGNNGEGELDRGNRKIRGWGVEKIWEKERLGVWRGTKLLSLCPP